MPLPKRPQTSKGPALSPTSGFPTLNKNIKKEEVELPEENEFTQLTEEEVREEDFNDYVEEKDTDAYIKEEEEKERQKEEKLNKPLIDDPFLGDTDEPEEEYIDKKKLKIIPFGGNKSKRKSSFARAKDFDDRKNTVTLAKALRTFVIIVLLGLFGMGIKNTFFPSYVYTPNDISSIAQQAVGQSGFPMNRGRAFAEQFAEAYLNFNSEDANSGKVLSSFYGSQSSENKDGVVDMNGKNNQKLLTSPRVFSETAVSPEIATFQVSGLVTDRKGTEFDKNGNRTSKWVALSITVYYDKDNQTLAVAKGSPQLVPSYGVADNTTQPQATPLGTGVAVPELFEKMKPTIDGFLKAYGASTSSSHADVDQYVKSNADPSLFAGFGGEYRIKAETVESSNTNIYPSSDKKDNKEWKVDLNISWEDTSSVDARDHLGFNGRYVMTIVQSSDSKYFVTAFRPYVYTPDANATK